MLIRPFLLLSFWLVPLLVRAQPAIDSLRALVDSHPAADTARVNRLNQLAYALRSESHQQTLQLGLQALALARQLGYQRGEATALYVIGVGHDQRTAYRIARQYLEEAQRLFGQLGDRAGRARVLSQLSWLFTERGEYVTALTNGLAAFELANKTGRTELMAHTTARLGALYIALGDYPQGLACVTTALEQYEQLKDETGLYQQLNALGELHRLQGELAKATRYYEKAIRLANELENARLVAKAESNLAAVYVAETDYRSGLTTAHRALSVLRPVDDKGVVAWTETVLARAHLGLGRADSAIHYGRRSWYRSRESGYREATRDASDVLARAYARRGDFARAYDFHRQYVAYRDTLTGADTQRQTALLQYNYGLAEKQTQIALLRKDQALQAEVTRRQRLLLTGAVVGLVLILGLLFLAYRNNRQKQRANALLEQQKAELQAQRDQTAQALTDLKATQAQLIQSEKMASLGELTAGIAHEIQNPLNFVNNFSEVSVELLDELAQEQQKPNRDADLEADLLTDLRQNLQKISHHGGRASSIVRGMLQHSRASTGQREPTDLNALSDEYLRLSYHGLRAKDKSFNAELITRFDPNVGTVSVVPQDLGRVFLNLFNNAFYAVQQRAQTAPAGYRPTVTVTTQRTDGHVDVIIGDNGTGVPASVQQKIFQPFFTTKPTGQGTGLGLSLSYDIVTKGHSGTLTVVSREGDGTQFTIQLPG